MKYGISNKKGNKSVYCTAPKTLYVYEEKLRKEFNGDFTILIPNCMDGYSVLPLLRKNHYVDCYEMNNILIEGGYINNFYTRGLLAKVTDEELNDRMNLYKKNFYDKRPSLSSENEIVHMFLETLNNLEEKLINCECSNDSRFVTYSRRDFLNKEMYASLHQGNYEQAFYDIIDYVKADTWISMGDVPTKYNFQDIFKMDDEYKNSGIICKQEQEILLQMIKDFKNIVEKNKTDRFIYY